MTGKALYTVLGATLLPTKSKALIMSLECTEETLSERAIGFTEGIINGSKTNFIRTRLGDAK